MIYAGAGILQVQPVQNPLLSAGSDREYLPLAPAFSGGIGLEIAFSSEFSTVIEGGSTFSTSDYLEGYTNLEHSSANDMFHSMMIQLKYMIPRGWD